MIAYIKGILESINEESIIIEQNNFGYEIRIPTSIIEQLPPIGDSVKIYTYLYVREDAMILYGFLSQEDLNIFKLLITVNGIGPKGALGILSAISIEALKLAILTNDDNLITKAPGVGKKTAQRLIIDLKDKLKKSTEESPLMDVSFNNYGSDLVNEAISALISLGYSQSESSKAVKNIKRFDSVEDILKQALKQLARI